MRLFSFTSFFGILIIAGITTWMYLIPKPETKEEITTQEKILQTVQVVTLEQTERVLFKKYEGITRPSELKTFTTKANGNVTYISNKNSNINKGDILINISDPTLEQSLQTLQRDLTNTEEELRKNKILLEKGIIIKSKVDNLNLKNINS